MEFLEIELGICATQYLTDSFKGMIPDKAQDAADILASILKGIISAINKREPPKPRPSTQYDPQIIFGVPFDVPSENRYPEMA